MAEADPRLVNCQPMGSDGSRRWPVSLWMARAEDIGVAIRLIDLRAEPKAKDRNYKFAGQIAPRGTMTRQLLMHFSTNDFPEKSRKHAEVVESHRSKLKSQVEKNGVEKNVVVKNVVKTNQKESQAAVPGQVADMISESQKRAKEEAEQMDEAMESTDSGNLVKNYADMRYKLLNVVVICLAGAKAESLQLEALMLFVYNG